MCLAAKTPECFLLHGRLRLPFSYRRICLLPDARHMPIATDGMEYLDASQVDDDERCIAIRRILCSVHHSNVQTIKGDSI